MAGQSVSDLILKVASAWNEPGGISLDALKKGLSARSYDVVKNNFRVSLAVKRLVANGELIQTKGTGASGSFKISKVHKKKIVNKTKKPRAKKVKKTTPIKSATPNKSPKKTKRTLRSPKNAKRPATKTLRRVAKENISRSKASAK